MAALRQTMQKELIRREVLQRTSFFTAEELFSHVRQENSKVGIATIYRFLRALTEASQLHTYVCDRKTIYSNGTKNHSHFRCEKCGSIAHITMKNVDFLGGIQGEVCHFQLDVSGICEGCAER